MAAKKYNVIAFIAAGKAWLKQPVITRQDNYCTSQLLFVAVGEDDIDRLLAAERRRTGVWMQ